MVKLAVYSNGVGVYPIDNHCNNQCMRVVKSATQIAEVLQARAANQNLSDA